MKLHDDGVYLIDGLTLIPDNEDAAARLASEGLSAAGYEARKGTIAWSILHSHNESGDEEKLRIHFDKMTSHDITYVGIIQTARASGLEKFPIPYVLTNCHNSLCAVGGTINEDDHMFGLSAAKKYGGIYVPPHQAVIHQFAREMLAECGGMILGSDSHTRYGALGTMAVGEGGGELVKQLLGQTWDVDMPDVVAVYLTGEPVPGVGPQDVALAIIGAVFDKGYVKNKVMEFVGPGVAKLSADFRIGVDVMTTETTCLSSIWQTDDEIRDFYEIHGRGGDYHELAPARCAYYEGCIEVDLSKIRPMIAMPFHPSNVYTIEEVQQNLDDVLNEVEKRAKVSFGDKVDYSLHSRVRGGKLYCDQGIIAGCAGGGFENICAAADILKGSGIGADAFTLSVYPASMPVYMELVKNGRFADLIEAGAVVKTAFCGPCFGAGDTPANGAFSIRHSTRNFPNREGSKVQNGQIASVALMDARSIAATAANKGFLTAATQVDAEFTHPRYFFDRAIYDNRVFDSKGEAHPEEELVFGPNIKDWPAMSPLPENLLLRVVSEIHDPVTTTDELIPSGETSSYRSNPLGLAEFTLSRKDPEYVPRAKAVQRAQKAVENGADPVEELRKAERGAAADEASAGGEASGDTALLSDQLSAVLSLIDEKMPGLLGSKTDVSKFGIGSTIFAVKPGDGSAREQAASCQKVLGGWANIAFQYATKRYRSNLINWGMLPLVTEEGELPFGNGDWILLPDIRTAVLEKSDRIKGLVFHGNELETVWMTLGDMTDHERRIIADGCLINYNRAQKRS
ncbi:MAG: hydratase [Lachnospiraceae bacterium]|nr:hydratase [Lachnospiraceae bacterium]